VYSPLETAHTSTVDENQRCAHQQVTKVIFRVKAADSPTKEDYNGKKQASQEFTGIPSDFNKPAVPVKENYPVSYYSTSHSKINEEKVVHSDCKKHDASVKENSPFSVSPKSKGVINEEVQYVMSQIDLSYEREA
jgi:hypothetical protein